MNAMKDPYIRYQYRDDKRVVEAQCSAAHAQISRGAATPLEAGDRAAYVEWCRETGVAVAEHVPAAVTEAKRPTAPAAKVPEVPEIPAATVPKVEEEPEQEAPPPAAQEPERIPPDFPCAAELEAVGILTFDKIPADLMVTRVRGIGRAGATKVAAALAARKQ